MRRSLFLVSSILLLVSLSCQFLFPQNSPTAQPQATLEMATIPPLQNEPTRLEPTRPEPTQSKRPQEQEPTPAEPLSTATLPPAPEPLVVLEDMNLMFWNVRVSYDPAVWQPGGTDGPPVLEHQQLSTCNLYEQGPTEPPPPDREVTLGPVTYMVAEMESQGNPIHWYMAVEGPQGAFADGIPTLVLSSSPEQLEQCRRSAEEVLASMR